MLFVIGISTHTEVQRAMERELLKKADVWQR